MSSVIVLRLGNRLLESSLSQILSSYSYTILHYPPDPPHFLEDDTLLLTDHLAGDRPERTILIVSGSAIGSLPLSEAFGLVSLHSDVQEIVICLHTIALGGRYVSPTLVQKHLESTEALRSISEGDSSVLLSRREREIFLLIKQGRTLKEIAIQLFISPNTAERHRASIQQKLNLRGRNCLVRFAATQVAWKPHRAIS